MKWLLAFCVVGLLASCAATEPYPYKSVPRQHINEVCQTFRNYEDSDAEFTAYVYKRIADTPWVSIRWIKGRTLDSKIQIMTAVVYYKRRD